MFTGTRPVAPSALALRDGEIPRALSIGEIEELVDNFAQAARRARDAGFDAVEFHAAHGYLLNQFLSPLWNQRDDRYGGSLQNRARFLTEILMRARQLLGEDFPILVRLCASEAVPGGITIGDACEVARLLVLAGADVMDVTAGIGESTAVSVPSTFAPAGSLVPLAAAVRNVVRVPVIAVGKLHQPALAETVLAEGKADLIALGRALIADPFWPAKASEGRCEDIRPCLACSTPDCHGRTTRQLDLACVVNPVVGRERMFGSSAAVQVPKRVVVVGGGPAGMEAAMAASRRGHAVDLFERNSELGGQVNLAAKLPRKEEVRRYLGFMKRAVADSGVRVHLGVEATPERIRNMEPDVVIVATGAKPAIPDIPVKRQQVASAWDVLAGRVLPGANVVVVGGGDVGCETAEFLAGLGKRVTILEMLSEVGSGLIWWNRNLLVQALVAAHVEILTNSRLLSVEAGSATYVRGGVVNWLDQVDTVVFATGAVPEDGLAKALAGMGVDVRLAGDCAKPGNIGSAVRHGFEVGTLVD
jgi:NADPH-dependent 2,4-dienoyl-CoA reductase/sulfur reductase-like enzyme